MGFKFISVCHYSVIGLFFSSTKAKRSNVKNDSEEQKESERKKLIKLLKDFGVDNDNQLNDLIQLAKDKQTQNGAFDKTISILKGLFTGLIIPVIVELLADGFKIIYSHEFLLCFTELLYFVLLASLLISIFSDVFNDIFNCKKIYLQYFVQDIEEIKAFAKKAQPDSKRGRIIKEKNLIILRVRQYSTSNTNASLNTPTRKCKARFLV